MSGIVQFSRQNSPPQKGSIGRISRSRYEHNRSRKPQQSTPRGRAEHSLPQVTEERTCRAFIFATTIRANDQRNQQQPYMHYRTSVTTKIHQTSTPWVVSPLLLAGVAHTMPLPLVTALPFISTHQRSVWLTLRRFPPRGRRWIALAVGQLVVAHGAPTRTRLLPQVTPRERPGGLIEPWTFSAQVLLHHNESLSRKFV